MDSSYSLFQGKGAATVALEDAFLLYYGSEIDVLSF